LDAAMLIGMQGVDPKGLRVGSGIGLQIALHLVKKIAE
jgi:hypothetical protein